MSGNNNNVDLSKSVLGKRKVRSVAMELPSNQSNHNSNSAAGERQQQDSDGELHLTDPTKQLEGQTSLMSYFGGPGN